MDRFLNRFSVVQKIVALAAFNIGVLILVSGVALFKFQTLGEHLIELAERDVPLMENLMKATTHQLEQAIAFEKALKEGEIYFHDPEHLDTFKRVKADFYKLNVVVGEELHEAAVKAEEFLQDDHLSDEAREIFETVHGAVTGLEKKHKDYADHAGSLFDEIVAGEIKLVHKHEVEVEAEQEEIDHALKELLFEVEHFIAEEALKTEHEEKAAQNLLMILAAVGVAIGALFSFVMSRNMAIQEKMANYMKECLTGLQNNVMIADANDDIIYLNNASISALSELESTIRQQYPDFAVNKLVGGSIHRMHKNPDRIRNILNALQPGQVHHGEIKIGDLTLELNVGPVYQRGQRIGSYAEWRDITEQVKAAEDKEQLEEQIAETAQRVNAASAEITTGNMDLSGRTEAQAANIEETTATMQQVTEKVQESANNAQAALDLAGTTREAANRGGEVVNSAIEAMGQISESAERINDIIGVIDEIAFQTNLLALNAAVEAARAGEAGRGFAVVASEVRALAGRSAEAAKEIKDLITESVARVKAGTQQVNDTGECLNEIIESVEQVTGMMQEISTSSQDQALSISEINKSVTQMDSFTQQNAALVEEAAAASKSLQEQASGLMQLVAGGGGSQASSSNMGQDGGIVIEEEVYESSSDIVIEDERF